MQFFCHEGRVVYGAFCLVLKRNSGTYTEVQDTAFAIFVNEMADLFGTNV